MHAGILPILFERFGSSINMYIHIIIKRLSYLIF